MSIGDLRLGRAWVRARLLTITAANGYPVELKSAAGETSSDPNKTNPSKMPHARVGVVDGAGPTLTPNGQKGTASLPAVVEILFQAASRKEDGTGQFGHDECDLWVEAVAKALRTGQAPPLDDALAWRVGVAGTAEYAYTTGRLTGVRIPIKIEVQYTRAEA